MNVSPDRVVQLVREGLAPSLAGDPALVDFATRLARDVVIYGERGMPRAMFAKPSGRDVAAMVCEDFEGAAVVAPLLPGRTLEISHGWGLISFVLAVQHPQLDFETLEDDRDRQWFLRRLALLFGVRNLVVHTQSPSDFTADHREAYDLVLVKHLGPEAALDLAEPLLRDHGRILSFQTRDRSAEVRRPRANDRARALRLQATTVLASAPARGRVILQVGSPAHELDDIGVTA